MISNSKPLNNDKAGDLPTINPVVNQQSQLKFYHTTLSTHAKIILRGLKNGCILSNARATRLPLFLINQISTSLNQLQINNHPNQITDAFCKRLSFILKPIPQLMNYLIQYNNNRSNTLSLSYNLTNLLLTMMESKSMNLKEKKIAISIMLDFLPAFCSSLDAYVKEVIALTDEIYHSNQQGDHQINYNEVINVRNYQSNNFHNKNNISNNYIKGYFQNFTGAFKS